MERADDWVGMSRSDGVLHFAIDRAPSPQVFTLSLHDALPIYVMTGAPDRMLRRLEWRVVRRLDGRVQGSYRTVFRGTDRKSTRLNSSHVEISYAVFRLQKKRGRRRCWLTVPASAQETRRRPGR